VVELSLCVFLLFFHVFFEVFFVVLCLVALESFAPIVYKRKKQSNFEYLAAGAASGAVKQSERLAAAIS
jgi:hypothetical protein